jgi:Flp pilus assembly protein TadG
MADGILLKLVRHEKGQAIMEAAIVLPFLFAMVAGVVDVSRAYAQKVKIQQAAARSMELATATATSFDPANPASFTPPLKADAAQAAGVPTAQVATDNWLECAGVRQANTSVVCGTGQFSATYVSVNVSGSYRPIFALALKYLRVSSDGTVPLTGYAEVRIL